MDLMNTNLKLNRMPILEKIHLDKINANHLNNKNRLRNIEKLALLIEKDGLMKPLEVYFNEAKNEYTLIGGERRYTALKLLQQNGKLEHEELMIPCLIQRVKTEEEILLKLHMSNAQEEFTNQDKVIICKDLLRLINNNPDLKPKGMPTVEWLAPFLGCKARTAQKIKNIAEGKEELPKELEDEPEIYLEAEEYFKSKFEKKIKVTKNKVVISYKNEEELADMLTRF